MLLGYPTEAPVTGQGNIRFRQSLMTINENKNSLGQWWERETLLKNGSHPIPREEVGGGRERMRERRGRERIYRIRTNSQIPTEKRKDKGRDRTKKRERDDKQWQEMNWIRRKSNSNNAPRSNSSNYFPNTARGLFHLSLLTLPAETAGYADQ